MIVHLDNFSYIILWNELSQLEMKIISQLDLALELHRCCCWGNQCFEHLFHCQML